MTTANHRASVGPGFTDERIHLFAATGLERGDTSHEVDEFMTVIKTHALSAWDYLTGNE